MRLHTSSSTLLVLSSLFFLSSGLPAAQNDVVWVERVERATYEYSVVDVDGGSPPSTSCGDGQAAPTVTETATKAPSTQTVSITITPSPTVTRVGYSVVDIIPPMTVPESSPSSSSSSSSSSKKTSTRASSSTSTSRSSSSLKATANSTTVISSTSASAKPSSSHLYANSTRIRSSSSSKSCTKCTPTSTTRPTVLPPTSFNSSRSFRASRTVGYSSTSLPSFSLPSQSPTNATSLSISQTLSPTLTHTGYSRTCTDDISSIPCPTTNSSSSWFTSYTGLSSSVSSTTVPPIMTPTSNDSGQWPTGYPSCDPTTAISRRRAISNSSD
ncbi:hypothetical protein DSL72_003332 [Monilinia vaccinii-corymbosi]|uniref:Uncharacterized protein n=1 Tax=Monilinia vaccinii-corymbosi TaxID=61207 RepID=A0A8A3P8X0_9HELO|nr:hypothetical protein DSL72_003332 [Monilinia vaccinii-corymbosi]